MQWSGGASSCVDALRIRLVPGAGFEPATTKLSTWRVYQLRHPGRLLHELVPRVGFEPTTTSF